jgi:hypothetical protein
LGEAETDKTISGDNVRGIDMKITGSIISFSFLALLLLTGCLDNSSNIVKSGSGEYGNVSPLNWIKFGSDDSGNVYFYERGNLETDGTDNIVQVWEKSVLSNKAKEDYIQKRREYKQSIEGWEKLSEIKNLTKIDCAKQAYKTSSIMFCDKSGKVLDYLNFSERERDWKKISPDSRVEKLLKEVCK